MLEEGVFQQLRLQQPELLKIKFKLTGFQELVKNNYIPDSEPNVLFIFSSMDFTSLKKFEQLEKSMNNPFMNPEQKLHIMDVFCNIQKIVHATYRLKNAWRFQKAKTYNTEDLLMNPISEGDKNTIAIIQNNTKYIFPVRELLQMVRNALSNCCHYFPDPLECKNPYTNLPFDKSTLYNIYFAARRSNLRIPILFESFFQSNFNYSFFLTNNEEYINDEYLKTYVENHCINNLLSYVEDMFFHHHIQCRIHSQFPKDILLQIMKPYLTLYFVSQYSLNNHKKMRAAQSLRRRINKFYEYNPNFGKKKVKMIPDKPFSIAKKCIFMFDDRHIPFTNIADNFLKSHLDHPSSYQPTPPLPQDSDDSSGTEFDDDDDDDETPHTTVTFSNGIIVDNDDDDDDIPIIITRNSSRHVIMGDEEENDHNPDFILDLLEREMEIQEAAEAEAEEDAEEDDDE
jgi:hypothetical protein